jgi:hypothetical protein
MSEPKEPDYARGWRYVEKLIAEEDGENEAARLEKLSADEVAAELRQQGRDPAAIPSAEDLIARGLARAAQRAAEAKAVNPPAMKAEAATAAKAPPGPAPPVPPVAPVVPIRRWWRTPVWLSGVAAALFIVVIFKMSLPPPPVGKAPPVTDRDLAEVGRDQAEAQCALKDWVRCKQLLDDARAVDPEGESEARVAKARAEIAAALGDSGR